MKLNQWTVGLAAAGVVSLASVAQAEEAKNQVLTAVSGTTLSGYVNTAARWNMGTPAGVTQFLNGANGADGFNLDGVNVTLSKAAGEGEFAAGYKAELLFGADGNNLGSGFAPIKQAYVNLKAPVGNGLDIKLGVFDTPTGYEVFNAGDNPNYTRSWGNTLESTIHTGVLLSYMLGTDNCITLTAGVANTTDNVINGRVASAQTQKTYIGGIAITAPESAGFLKGYSLSAFVVDGRATGAVAGPDTTAVYVGASSPEIAERVKLGVALDSFMRNGFTDTLTFAGYASIKINDKTKLNLRGDYLDNNGSAIANASPFVPGTVQAFGLIAPATESAATSAARTAGAEILTTTITLDYTLWENVLSRLEYRWDHAASGRVAGLGPFGGGRVNANQLVLNVIYKF